LRDFYNGVCANRTTTLTVGQRISGNCGLARGDFGARSCSLDCPLSVRLRSLFVDRHTVLPRTHAADDTALVRLRGKGGNSRTAGRRGRDSKFSNRSDGKRRTCCLPGHLHEYYGDLASPRWRSCHGRSASERCSRPCRFWRSTPNAASHSSATWISPSPHCRARCLSWLECRLICRTASRILGLKLFSPIRVLIRYQVCLLLPLLGP